MNKPTKDEVTRILRSTAEFHADPESATGPNWTISTAIPQVVRAQEFGWCAKRDRRSVFYFCRFKDGHEGLCDFEWCGEDGEEPEKP